MTDILITGSTGSTGGAAAASLDAAGVPFRAMTRRTGVELPPHAEPVVADFDDDRALDRALAGIRAAYLVTPSTEQAEAQQKRFIDAAARAGVDHVVLLSQFAATIDSPVRFLRYHAAVEEHLADSGIASTVLRPNLFMQGLLTLRTQIIEGTLPAPIGNARVSAVDVRDIGAVAAATLTGSPAGILTLTGPDALTHAEMAELLAARLGHPVRFVDIGADDFAAAIRPHVPEWQVGGLIEDYTHYAAGEADAVTADIAHILGRPATSFTRFVDEVAAGALTP